nr:hypothetical protein CFP56_31492 [Quercus suber]
MVLRPGGDQVVVMHLSVERSQSAELITVMIGGDIGNPVGGMRKPVGGMRNLVGRIMNAVGRIRNPLGGTRKPGRNRTGHGKGRLAAGDLSPVFCAIAGAHFLMSPPACSDPNVTASSVRVVMCRVIAVPMACACRRTSEHRTCSSTSCRATPCTRDHSQYWSSGSDLALWVPTIGAL